MGESIAVGLWLWLPHLGCVVGQGGGGVYCGWAVVVVHAVRVTAAAGETRRPAANKYVYIYQLNSN